MRDYFLSCPVRRKQPTQKSITRILIKRRARFIAGWAIFNKIPVVSITYKPNYQEVISAVAQVRMKYVYIPRGLLYVFQSCGTLFLSLFLKGWGVGNEKNFSMIFLINLIEAKIKPVSEAH